MFLIPLITQPKPGVAGFGIRSDRPGHQGELSPSRRHERPGIAVVLQANRLAIFLNPRLDLALVLPADRLIFLNPRPDLAVVLPADRLAIDGPARKYVDSRKAELLEFTQVCPRSDQPN